MAADRIHLVVDCVVNDWLTEVFNRSRISYVSPTQSNDGKRRIIEELRQQNTEHANRLADEMENS